MRYTVEVREHLGAALRRRGKLPYGELMRWAELLDLDERTLRNWRAHGSETRRPGRPRHSREAWMAALWLVARTWRSQGRTSGWPRVMEALESAGRSIPLRVVRGWIWLLKAHRRRYLSRRRESECKHMEVLCRDAVWSQDATHLGRDEQGGKVEALAVKDVGPIKLIASSVGGPACSSDVLELLVRALVVRGTLPLVIVMDNGPANRNGRVIAWLREQRVIVLWNLPHTPQHNPWIESFNGELKGELEADGVLPVRDADPSQCPVWASEPGVSRMRELLHESIVRTGQRLNENRLRRSRGWRTAEDLDRILPRAEDRVDRDRFYEDTCSAIAKAVQDIEDDRARRRAEREAVLCTLEEFGLVRRSRGRRPIAALKPEGIS